MAAVDRALALKPDWDRAVLLKAELTAKRSGAEAVRYLEAEIRKSPDSRPLRGALAQFLTEQKRYGEARELYRKLLESDRAQRELQFGIAVLSVQMKDWAAAEAELGELKRAGFGDAGQVEFYLAQVSEERGRLDEAIARYKEVPEGERGWLAKLRIAAVMGKQGKRTEARRWLADLPAVTIEQRVQVRQTEAQLYRDANDNATALGIIEQGLKEHVDAHDLLYDRAMVLEKLDRISDAEATLRRLVELKPDDAQSLNALGYTLVDRTSKLDEGFKLIERAHKLAPADPFILDSMGWALFRLGRLDEAEAVPGARVRGAAGSGDRSAPWRSAVRERAAAEGARDLAVAAQGIAGPSVAARDDAPACAVALCRSATTLTIAFGRSPACGGDRRCETPVARCAPVLALRGALLAACASAPPVRTSAPVSLADEPFEIAGRLSARHGSEARRGELSLDASRRSRPADACDAARVHAGAPRRHGGSAFASSSPTGAWRRPPTGRRSRRRCSARRFRCADLRGGCAALRIRAARIRSSAMPSARASVLRQDGWEIVYGYGEARRPADAASAHVSGHRAAPRARCVERCAADGRSEHATLTRRRAGEGQPVPARRPDGAATAIT